MTNNASTSFINISAVFTLGNLKRIKNERGCWVGKLKRIKNGRGCWVGKLKRIKNERTNEIGLGDVS